MAPGQAGDKPFPSLYFSTLPLLESPHHNLKWMQGLEGWKETTGVKMTSPIPSITGRLEGRQS